MFRGLLLIYGCNFWFEHILLYTVYMIHLHTQMVRTQVLTTYEVFTLVTFVRLSCTVESLEFVVAQFSWHSWVALANEFISSTITDYKRFSLPSETKSWRIHEITSQRTCKKLHNPRKLALTKLNDPTIWQKYIWMHLHLILP